MIAQIEFPLHLHFLKKKKCTKRKRIGVSGIESQRQLSDFYFFPCWGDLSGFKKRCLRGERQESFSSAIRLSIVLLFP